jgi:hypothetical protein
MLNARCANGDEKVRGAIVNPQSVNRDDPFTLDPLQVQLYGFGVGISIPVGPEWQRLFRVVERTFGVCCPLVAGDVFRLTLESRWGPGGAANQMRTDFAWNLTPPR